jgi:hypothetical protein
MDYLGTVQIRYKHKMEDDLLQDLKSCVLFAAFKSKWLYLGTDKGNVHIMNLDSFTLSG